jgi:glutathione reductase (NADPH)
VRPEQDPAARRRDHRQVIDRATDHIAGAHLLGPGYSELLNILGLAIRLNLTTRQLKSMTAAYPTHGSDLGSML